jgi:hypothetical protein
MTDEVLCVAVEGADSLKVQALGQSPCLLGQTPLYLQANGSRSGQQMHQHQRSSEAGADVHENVPGCHLGAFDGSQQDVDGARQVRDATAREVVLIVGEAVDPEHVIGPLIAAPWVDLHEPLPEAGVHRIDLVPVRVLQQHIELLPSAHDRRASRTTSIHGEESQIPAGGGA